MKKRPIYYDTETTGVKSDTDRIIEIAAYDPVQDRSYVSFINPGMPIPPDSTAIHNITDEMVSDAPNFAQVGSEFAAFCEGDTVLIAHNNDAFDKKFLDAEFARADLPPPSWPYIDTLKWARKYRPDLPRHSLQHLREVYGFAANNAHRALDDVIILYKVFSAMIGDLSMETIMNLLAQEEVVRKMPFGKHKGALLQDVPKNYVLWLFENGALDKDENEGLKKGFAKLGVLPS